MPHIYIYALRRIENKINNILKFECYFCSVALPLAADINESGQYFRYIIPLLVGVWVTTVIKTPQGVVIGFPNFAWAPN